MSLNKFIILYIDTDDFEIDLLKHLVKAIDFVDVSIIRVNQFNDALLQLSNNSNIDLVLFDLRFSKNSILESITHLRNINNKVPLTLLIGNNLDINIDLTSDIKFENDFIMHGDISFNELYKNIKRIYNFKLLKYRLDFENLITSLSSQFLNATFDNITVYIENALSNIGNFTQVSCITLFKNVDNHLQVISEWYNSKQVVKVLNNNILSDDILPDIVLALKNYIIINIDNTLDIMKYEIPISPEQIQIITNWGSKSLLMIPIFVNNKFWGVLSIEDFVFNKVWSEEDISLLKLIIDIVGNTYLRLIKEKELKDSSLFIETVISNTVDLVWHIDKNFKFIYCSGNFEIIGYDPSELIGNCISEIIPEGVWIALQDLFTDVVKKYSNISQFGFYAKCKNNEDKVIFMELNASPLFDNNNVFQGIVGTCHDITDYFIVKTKLENINHNLEDEVDRRVEELKKSKEEAVLANKLKGEFISNVSHEIRTPLNSIIGFSNLLMNSKVNIEQRKYLNYIISSGDILLHLINDILDFSKLEAGKFELVNQVFSISEVVNEVINIEKVVAYKKKLDINNFIDFKLDFNVMGDSMRLTQVLLNLVNNGLKFCDKGGVNIYVKVINKDDAIVRFSVKDTGIGISEENQKKLFHSFVQVDGSSTRKYGGTGLGLTIANRLVLLMGGSGIKVESRVGYGSNFYFDVKFVKADDKFIKLEHNDIKKEENVIETLISNKKYRILVVEDNFYNTELVNIQLTQLGHIVTCVDNGQKAIDIIQVETFDIVLMDIQLPDMSGYDVTKFMRERNIQLPIIALTGNTINNLKEFRETTGMNFYIQKPLNVSKLVGAIESIVNNDISEKDSSNPYLTNQKIFDSDILLENVDNNKMLCQEFYKVFNNGYLEFIKIILPLIQENKYKEVETKSHSFKSVALSVGAVSIYKLVYQIESKAIQNSLIGIDNVISHIKDDYVLFKKEFDVFKSKL